VLGPRPHDIRLAAVWDNAAAQLDRHHDAFSRDAPRPNDDEAAVDARQDMFANASVVRAGASRTSGIRICYVMLGKEYESEDVPLEADRRAVMDNIMSRIRVPISAVRAYRGEGLIEEIVVRMRGGS
jgi:hypothetical protein